MHNVLKKGKRRYFEGWYFKQQNGSETVAFIPAYHVNDAGEASASLQVITDEAAHRVDFLARAFLAQRKGPIIRLGECAFSPQGCKLDVKSKEVSLSGTLRFGSFTPPACDIMGPFALMPFIECRHSVASLFHRVDGALTLNGRQYVFENGSGYVEGDRGTSFPERYIWTHCNWKNNSIMLSVADIPFGALRFVGCVGFIFLNGKERRIATYRGVKLLRIGNDAVSLRQGNLTLDIQLIQANSHPLYAPHRGEMSRTIHESPSCTVRYTCREGGDTLFDFVSDQAGFENNWRGEDEPVE